MSNLRSSSLRGKINVKHGFPFKSEYFSEKGDLVVLTPGNFFEEGGFKRNEEKDKYYNTEFPKEYLLKKGDLLVAMTQQAEGLLGSMAYVPENGKFLHNQRLGLVSPVSDDVDVDFIYHLFKTNSVREQLRLTSTGSKVKHTSPEKIYDVIAFIPPIINQKRIAKVLSTIDEKIELNNRINAELEALSKLIYDYWFVQFDFPISAEQAASMGRPELKGKPYKTSGGPMYYNPTLKRKIPVGWVDSNVSNLLARESKSVKIPSSDIQKRGKYPVVDQSSDFICGFTDKDEALISNIPKIVFGDHTRILKFVNFEFTRGADGTQLLSSNNIRMPIHLFYHTLSKYDLSNYGYARHFKFLKEQVLVLPDQTLASTFERIASSFYNKLKNNIFENQQLTELRDWLLPMLMNGQVTVK